MTSIIVKRIKGSDDFDEMRSSNDQSMSSLSMKDGAEQDMSAGKDNAAEKVMSALHSKDTESLKSALYSLFDMYMEEKKEDDSEY